jgi:hypothetical protein
MDVTEYNIYRITTQQVRNNWNEILFDAGQVVQCTEDLGDLWLAKPLGSNSIPRMLPKSQAERIE